MAKSHAVCLMPVLHVICSLSAGRCAAWLTASRWAQLMGKSHAVC